MFYASECIAHAARDGARLAMDASVSNGTVSQRVIDSAAPFTVSSSNIAISSRTAGSQLTVTVTYHFTSFVPLLSSIMNVDISSTRIARVQD
jgi:hypothetical protein